MAQWPLKRIGEVLIDGVWARVPMREDTSVTITRGIGAEAVTAQPAGTSVRINDPDAIYSPRNAESDLYGKFGRNTQFRFRVADAPATPAAVLSDTFTRTVANGWGTSTSGTTWSIYDPTGVSPPAAEYSVSGGAGKITSSTLNASRYIATSGLNIGDYEATFTINANQIAQDTNTEEPIWLTPILRVNRTNHQYYMVPIALRPRTGVFGIGGLSVGVQITKVDLLNNDTRGLCPARTVPGLGYAIETSLRVRVRCAGPEIFVRVWTDGEAEPENWHAQTYDESFTSGEFGFRARCDADDTTTPIVYSFDNLEIRPLTEDDGTVRMVGELAAFESYEDESGADAYVDVDAAGVLRRYDGPQKPARSALARHVAGYRPCAYWPFEEGAQGSTSVAQVADNSPAGPLAASRIDFARDTTLTGSGPLPTVRAGGTLRSTGIPGFATGRWAVYFMMKFTTQGYPMDGAEHQILSFSTNNVTLTLYAAVNVADPRIILRGVDSSGAAIGVTLAAISQENLINAGKLGFLDRWQRVKVRAQESGGSTTYTLSLIDLDDTGLAVSLDTAAHGADRVRAVNTTFGTGVAGMGIGHLSVWGVAFTDAYTQQFENTDLSFEIGCPGLTTKDWLSILGTDQRQALETEGPADTLLGPYYDDTFIGLVQAAARTDMGLLTEHRDRLGLRYVSRQALYDRPVDLVLDYRSGLIFSPFKPKDDDKGLINRITVKRREGSEASAEVSEGPLSVQPPPNGINVNDDSADTIVSSDDQLPSQAGWRLHVAAWDAMRVASLTLKMANPRMRVLLDTVLGLKEGSRIQVVNAPKRYGPDGFDLLVRGSKETHAEGVFDITFNCSPYRPYVTGLVVEEGSAVSPTDPRADTSGAQLDEDLDATETGVNVLTANGRKWITTATYPADFPFDIVVGGERMRVTAVTGATSSQTFTVVRSVNGVVKTHVTGTPIELADPTPVAL
ncbi:hypothetical protein GCM10023084_05640 [Streptomyces lacrimifluminis]|uniref:Uncharacterized protein n=1 Tax=Streptomyces lacrimifluminis TaxID=1500077 RepID=A0A917NS53_9ACTN|nr:hypothetical protein [Streptomyces lacrimifluminis]GGJ23007.1 hypothetical protein GCM10012282_19380 [Streptomyces lacrimifluminis]